MKKRLLITICSAAAVIVLTLIGNWILSPNHPAEPILQNIDDPDTIYNQAVSVLDTSGDMTLSISTTLQTTVNDEVFLEISQQTLSYQGLGTESFRAQLDETLSIDSHSVEISEAFADSTAFVTLGDGHFSAQLTPQDYLSRFAPAILLDAQLYGSITGIDSGDEYVITFEQPTAAEVWAMRADSSLLEASGTAYVTYEGQLTKSIYSISYTQGNANYRKTVIVEPVNSAVTIEVPGDAAQYTDIIYFDGPRSLERSTGYLLQGKAVSSEYTESAYFQAFGDKRTKNITLHTYKGDAWSALVDTNEILTNDSYADQASQQQKTERFLDNKYTISTNGDEPVYNSEISADDMYGYCRNLLVGTIMLPQYITQVQYAENEGILHITFAANEAFANLIRSNICQALYQNSDLLTDPSQTNTTNELLCYIDLDSNTGLPLRSGILYNGTSTIEGLPYQLQFQADQTYDLISKTASTAING